MLLPKMMSWAYGQGHTAVDIPLFKRWAQLNRGPVSKDELASAYEDLSLVRLDGPQGPILAYTKHIEGELRLASWLAAKGPTALPLPAPPSECTPSQARAWEGLGTQGRAILTGGPGTGKTWLLARLISELKKKRIVKIAAPTGRASSHLGSVCGVPSQTVHKMIGLITGQSPIHGRYNPIDADVIVLDESSMLDSNMMGLFIEAIDPKTQVILVGDPRQLLPVEAGSPFHVMVERQSLPVFTLTETVRQGEGSTISALAHSVVEGKPRFRVSEDVQVFIGNPEDWYLQHEGQILSPVKDGRYGVDEINRRICAVTNPGPPIGRTRFRWGDKVIANVNRKHYMNGHIGWVVSGGVQFDKLTVEVDSSTLSADFSHAYCITVHKSQGGEYKDVLFVNEDKCSQQLAYTAITRAKKRLWLTSPGALARSCKPEVRVTALPYLIGWEGLEELRRKLDPQSFYQGIAKNYEW